VSFPAPLRLTGRADEAALVSADDASDREETLAALAAGNESALRRVYREHHGPIRVFARRLVGEPAAAEDLVQEVFVRLPRAARRYRGGSLRSFLLAMAINNARHFVRAAARRRSTADRLAREMTGRASYQPEDGVERRQTAEALMRALDRLPFDQRLAFILCEVDERRSADAAALAGTSDGTMRARLYHAKRKLRVALVAQGYGDGHGEGGER
jgi:RNA polymerase sigma-70 factor, ECF subfamily